MLKGIKFRIYPNQTQKEQLAKFFGVSRLVYNRALDLKTKAYAKDKTNLSKFDLIKELVQYKKEVDYIRECPSQVLQQAIMQLDTAYKNFFKGIARFPKFKNKYANQSITFPQHFIIFTEDNRLQLPKLGEVKIKYHREINGVAKSVTLSRTKTHKYFVSILVDTKQELPEKKEIREDTTVGVDFGLKDLAITSDGKFYPNHKFFVDTQRKLRRAQRSLARKKKGSNNREKQRLRVAKLHEKVRNQRTDYLHKISTELVKQYDTICIEDLAVKNMIKNRRLSKAISDVGWHKLKTMLEYKADWNGKNLVMIGRFDPSSKLCSSCGNKKKKLSQSQRTYICHECGFRMDRDLNASINIKNFGLGRSLCKLTQVGS